VIKKSFNFKLYIYKVTFSEFLGSTFHGRAVGLVFFYIISVCSSCFVCCPVTISESLIN